MKFIIIFIWHLNKFKNKQNSTVSTTNITIIDWYAYTPIRMGILEREQHGIYWPKKYFLYPAGNEILVWFNIGKTTTITISKHINSFYI